MGAYFRYQGRAIACAYQELLAFIRAHAPGAIFAGLAAFLAIPLIRVVPLLRQQQVNPYQEAVLQILYGMAGPLILLSLLFLVFWIRSGSTLYWHSQRRIGELENAAGLRATWCEIATALQGYVAEGSAIRHGILDNEHDFASLVARISAWEKDAFEYLTRVGLYAESVAFRAMTRSDYDHKNLEQYRNPRILRDIMVEKLSDLNFTMLRATDRAVLPDAVPPSQRIG